MSPNYLYLNSRDYLLRLDVNHIVYFEADGNYTNIVSANKVKNTVGMTLSKMQELLTQSLGENAQQFARIGKSHIIGIKYISQIDIPKQALVLSDGHSFAFKVVVSKDALKKLKDLLTKTR
ncbi:MAG: LytTR family transcriptional regulator [Paludibacteraceae bacterium]|nr:LytTR family transcriptional regulator [Paludibacteraceae bacterium]